MEPMTRAVQRPRKTIQDLLALGEDVRAELIEGEIYVAAALNSRHQGIVVELTFRLHGHVKAHGLGRVFVAPLDVYLPTGDVVEPDLVFVSAARGEMIGRDIRGAPDLVVEVVSPGNPERDRLVKRLLYECNGVAEYWIIEPDDEAIEVLRLVDGAYQPAGYLRGDARLTSPLLPDFESRVGDLFA